MTKIVTVGRRCGKRVETVRQAIAAVKSGKTVYILKPDDTVILRPNDKGLPETKKVGSTKKLPRPWLRWQWVRSSPSPYAWPS